MRNGGRQSLSPACPCFSNCPCCMFYWSMARSGYWLMEYTSLSHILRQAPARYMRAYLHTEADKNDTTYFLLHQLQTIRHAIAALPEYVARKSREQKETVRLLASSPSLRGRFNHRQSALLNHALRHTGEAFDTSCAEVLAAAQQHFDQHPITGTNALGSTHMLGYGVPTGLHQDRLHHRPMYGCAARDWHQKPGSAPDGGQYRGPESPGTDQAPGRCLRRNRHYVDHSKRLTRGIGRGRK